MSVVVSCPDGRTIIALTAGDSVLEKPCTHTEFGSTHTEFGSLGPQVFAVYIYKGIPHRQDGITFAHRSGKYSKPSEMTGGALLLG